MAVDITTEIIASFRATFPQFSDDTQYPDDIVTYALCQGDMNTMGCLWGGFADLCSNPKRSGMFFYAAHWLATTYPAGALEPSNPSVGAGKNVSGKSVGDESISYQASSTSFAGDDWLMTTTYGQQFLRLSKQPCIGFFG